MPVDETGDRTETVHFNTNQNNSKRNDLIFCERLTNFAKLIKIEPVAFLFTIYSNLSSLTSQILALQKACRVI